MLDLVMAAVQSSAMTFKARLCVTVIACTAAFALILQTGVDLYRGEALGASLWNQSLYFTNISVLVVAIAFGVMAAKARWSGPGWPAAITVWMILVGLVYHALLAADHNPTGWDVLVNLIQHTILPLMLLIAWSALAPKDGLTMRHALIWVAYPLGYAAYAIARGLLAGKFPYFFLDPLKTGIPGVIGFVLGLGVLFFLSGWLIVIVAQKLHRRKTDVIPT